MKSALTIITRTNLVFGLRLLAITAIASLLIFGCPTPGGGSGSGTTVATPTIAPAPGSIQQDTAQILITCATAGATIHYTVDNTTPTATSPTYGTAVPASDFPEGALHVKAMAVLTGSTNSAVASADYTVIDTLAPTVVITSTYTTGVNGPFTVTVTFNDTITDFTSTCVSVTNANPIVAGDISGSGKVYTVHITPIADATPVTVQIPAGACHDAAAAPNANAISNLFSIFYDHNAPQATITSAASNPTNASPIHVTISFGAINVSGFDITDLTVGNGTASNFTTVDAAHYAADITPTAQGNVTVDIAAGTCTATATGSANLASSTFSIGYDTVAPSLVSVTPATGGYATSSPVLITVTWSEAVSGFDASKIANLVNGSVSAFTAVTTSQYTFNLTPASQAAFGFDIAVGTCTDLAGNASTGSAAWSKTYHSTVPTISSLTPATGGYYTASPVPITVAWNEDVTGFDASDIGGLTNCSVSNFTALDAATYTFNLTPTAQGAFGFTIAAGACVDIASTQSAGPVSWSKTFDNIVPSVTSVSPATGGFTATSPIHAEVDWSEAVAGFNAADIGALADCTLSNFVQVTPSQYTFDLTPTGEGPIGFQIAPSACADLAGNANTGTTNWTMIYSTSMPYISSITPADGGYWTTTPVPLTINWDKAVTGFDVTDIGTLVNCAVSNFTAVSATQYTFTLTPTAQGAFGFTIAYNACTDLATNPSAGPVTWSRTFDNIAPTVSTITPATGGYTAASPVSVTINWSENVSGFSAADINSLTNCSIANFTAVSGSQYTLDVTPLSQAAFGFQIDPSSCADAAGNPSAGTTVWSKNYHTTVPTLTVGPVSGGYWTGAALPVTIAWNEDVTGFDVSDIGTLVNCTVSNFTQTDAAHYGFDLTPSGQGNFGFTVAAGACVDIASTASAGPVSWTRDFDNVGPTVSSVSPVTGGYTGTSPFTVNVFWTESVTGFDVSDIGSLVNCTVANFTTVSAQHYTFDLTPGSEAAFGFTIVPSACADLAGNASTGTTVWSKTYHTTIPFISGVTPATGGYQTFTPVPMTVNWNEDVTGFNATAIGSLVNGTVSNWVAVSGSQYTFTLTPTAQGAFGFTIAAGAGIDIAGNPSTVPVTWSKTFDTIAPSVSLVTPASGGFTASSPVNVEVDWTEAVSGFTIGDITSLVNCTVGNFVQVAPSQYTFDVTPASQVAFSFQIAAGVCADTAGNASTGTTNWSMTYSASDPTITAFTPTDNGYVTASPVSMTIDWDKAVTGFTSSDIGTLVNCTVSNFVQVTQAQYTFTLTPTAQGNFGFTVAAGACTDLALNPSSGPVTWNRTYDSIAPTVSSVTPVTGGYATSSPVTATVNWSEDVAGFNVADIASLVNCTVSNFTAVSASQYTFSLTPTGQGAFGFTISPSACADLAGNPSAGTTVWTRTYDSTIPTASISPTSTGYWTGAAIPMTITWSENVTGFDATDIGSKVNCSVSSWVAVSGSQYTFSLTPTGQGAFGFTIAAGACQDPAGNTSTGPVSWTKTYDSVPPTVSSVNPVTGGYATSSPTTITVNWSETVSGFTSGDIGTLVNCSVGNFNTVSGSQYTFDLTPSAQGAFGFTIAPSACADTAGNASTGTTVWTRTFDNIAPTVTINQAAAQADPATSSPINFTVVFSENVTGFSTGNITLSGTAGATTGIVTGGPATYNVAVSGMTGEGTVIAAINSSVAIDAAGNNNAASTSTDNTVTYALQHTVTYNGNGNDGGTYAPTDNNTYVNGNSVTVLGNIGTPPLTKAGYAFIGWSVNADGSGTSYIPGNTFTMGTSNVLLYAKWSALPTYTVTYTGNGNTGGSVPVDNTAYVQGSSVTVMSNTGNLTKTGNTFVGWYDATTLSTYTPGNQFVIDANTSLSAVWTPLQTYTVTYFGNTNTSGTVPVDSTSYLSGGLVTVMANSGNLVKTGYNFNGWNTAANGSGTGYNGGNTFLMGSANVSLYAQWTTIPTYTVTYNANGATGGSVPTDSGNYTTGQTVTVLANPGNLVRTNFAFSGWNTAADGSGTSYYTGNTFSMGSANVTLYVLWAADSSSSWTNFSANGLPTAPYDAVGCSADGTRIVVVVNGSATGQGIYTSTNSGTTWAQTLNVNQPFRCTAMSKTTGQYALAGIATGNLYLSTNYGANGSWAVSSAGNRNWRGVTISDNGAIMYAAVNGGLIYKSSNNGTTWAAAGNATSQAYYGISCSSDGSVVAAIVSATTGGIYVSTDSGATWTMKKSNGGVNAAWRGISVAGNGQIILGAIQAGTFPNCGIWQSNDPTKTFNTWTQTDTGTVSYRCLALSSDGSRAGVGIKGGTGGYASFSKNGGASWYQRTFTGLQVWTGIATLANGTKFYMTDSSATAASVWVYTLN